MGRLSSPSDRDNDPRTAMRILLISIVAFTVIISSAHGADTSTCRVLESRDSEQIFSVQGHLLSAKKPDIPTYPCPSNLTIFGSSGCSLCTLTDMVQCLGSAVTYLPSPSELPQWVSRYEVSSSLVQIIPKAAFVDKEIGEIHIENNELALINQKAFEGVKKVQYLTLANNGLPYIMVDMFNGLSDLVTLVLDDNNLEITNAGDFVSAANYGYLQQVKEKNFFTSVELQNLENLSLQNNPLKQLPKQSFRWLKNSKISYLSLQGSKIETVHKGEIKIIGIFICIMLHINLNGCAFCFRGFCTNSYNT